MKKIVKNRKRVYFFALLLFLFILAAFLFILRYEVSNLDLMPAQKPVVVTTFFPLADFTGAIARDEIDLHVLASQGVEPHDYEPTSKDLLQLNKAHLLVYNGAGLEPWLVKVLPDLNQQVSVVNTSDNVSLVYADHHDEHEEEDAREIHAEDNDELMADPHIWLDPQRAQLQVENISLALQAILPAKRAALHTNAANLQAQLATLDYDFASKLSNCQQDTVIVAHNALAYVADRYGFKVESIMGNSHDEEPTPAHLAEIVRFAKQNNIKHILYSDSSQEKIAQTVANEISADILFYNPLENSTATSYDGSNYLLAQQQNLSSLATALDCH